MNPNLGKHEIGIWRFIAAYKEAHDGRAPSYEECGQAIGIESKDHVSRDLQKLADAGYIRIIPGMVRAIELLRHPSEPGARREIVSLPVLGVIHAGPAIPTLEQNYAPIEWIDVARNLVGDGSNMYVLQARGDSMIDALINDGDYLVMEQTRVANNGDMVAVWLKKKHATTLKRFYYRDGWIVLRPENPTLKEKKYKPGDIEVQGKVVCVIRANPHRRRRDLLNRPIRPN